MSARASLIPTPKHMVQADAITYLRRQVFEDALQAGWLRPACRRGASGSVFYAFRDVERVSERVAAGEYPGQDT